MRLIKGDCIEVMEGIEDESVDLILVDPPYGTTANKWDNIIPFDKLWEHYERIIKPNGAILIFGSEPFSSRVRMSNPKLYKYDWIWDKGRGTNFATARIMPMKCHETISVFYKRKPTYNPIFWYSTPYVSRGGTRANTIEGLRTGKVVNVRSTTVSEDGRRYPLSILKFKRDGKRIHPTQKPTKLLEYLIKTYTNEGEVVLDNTMGSGSTGVACKNTNRHFIGIEMDDKYFNIAKERIESI